MVSLSIFAPDLLKSAKSWKTMVAEKVGVKGGKLGKQQGLLIHG